MLPGVGEPHLRFASGAAHFFVRGGSRLVRKMSEHEDPRATVGSQCVRGAQLSDQHARVGVTDEKFAVAIGLPARFHVGGAGSPAPD